MDFDAPVLVGESFSLMGLTKETVKNLMGRAKILSIGADMETFVRRMEREFPQYPGLFYQGICKGLGYGRSGNESGPWIVKAETQVPDEVEVVVLD